MRTGGCYRCGHEVSSSGFDRTRLVVRKLSTPLSLTHDNSDLSKSTRVGQPAVEKVCRRQSYGDRQP
jgi:hypothetical protein